MRAAVPFLAVALLAGGCTGDGGDAVIDREGSTVVDDEPVDIGELPEAYAITYVVEEFDGDDLLRRESMLTVARPFRSRFEHEDVLRVTHFAYFGSREPGDETEVVRPVPSAAPGDVRADVLPLGEGVETREVLDRRCRVHRLGASLLDGLYVEGDLVEACIDADGLVLEEVTTIEGEVILRRVATAVDLSPDISDDRFELEVRVRTVEEGGGSVQEVDPTSRPPGEFWQLDDGDVPPGFELLGRFATIPPQDARLDDEESRARYVASVTDVWTRGIDVLVVEQGGTLGRVPPFGDHPNGQPVEDVGELPGFAELIQHPNGAEVRVLLPPGRFVKVSGTLPGDDIVALTRSLRPVEGGDLVYLNPEEPSGG